MDANLYKQITLDLFCAVTGNFELQIYDITVKNGRVLKSKTKMISYTKRLIPLLFEGYRQHWYVSKDLANSLNLKDGRYYLQVLFLYDKESSYWDIKESKSEDYESFIE